MAGAMLGLDHVMICVADLEAARRDYERLGLVAAPLGDHAGKATANHCIMFPSTYLELIGINEPGKEDTAGVGTRLRTAGEGLHRVALGTPDADAAKTALEAAGLHPLGPQDLARPQTDPPGMVRFRNLVLPESETAGLGLFLCGHRTPELMRTAAWLAHPLGAIGLAAVTALVDDPEAAAVALARVFGAGSASPAPWGATVETGRGRILLAGLAGFGAAHPGLAAPAGPRPRFHALWLRVRSLAAAGTLLSKNGVTAERLADRIRILPRDAHGVPIELIAD